MVEATRRIALSLATRWVASTLFAVICMSGNSWIWIGT
jgi:hypothetical protein